MNMIVTPASPATPNGTTRPQVRIVIVGHVDHGKSTLVGRLLHETGSLPDGKLEMLKAVSARRGMPFEWSFLLDALQTERDQGITIDTTQIRFRTNSRDIVLIDAPGHAEFLRNMITGASQADGAVLIIDALEGVRDQTRRHGYLLHLATRFPLISKGSASRRPQLFRSPPATVTASPRAPAGSAGTTARPWSRRSMRSSRRVRSKRCRCVCRCRRSTSSTTAASWRAASSPAA
jgi:signal recognition particle receptor subunit beta